MNDTPVEEIIYPDVDRRVRVFRHGATVDTFAVVTDRVLVLLDTATRPETMRKVLDLLQPEETGRTLVVVNTHGDWDHVWGNSLFAGPAPLRLAPIIAHGRAVARMTGPGAEANLSSFQTAHPGVYDSVRLIAPTITFSDELFIHGGDLTLHFFPTPGHSPDHLAAWIPEIRCLLAGDAAEIPFPLVSDDGSLADLRRSLRRMRELDPSTALYCHAPGRTDSGVLEQNLAYFEELVRRCRESAGASDARDIGWPLEDALSPGLSLDDVSDLEFYRRFHDANVRAASLESRQQ